MNRTVSLRLDKALVGQLDRAARRSGKKRSQIIREALRRQLQLLRFEELRRRTAPFAELGGYLSDEDVMRDVS